MYAKAQIDGVAHFDFRLLNKSDLEHRILAVIESGGSLDERCEHRPEVPFAFVADPDGCVIEF